MSNQHKQLLPLVQKEITTGTLLFELDVESTSSLSTILEPWLPFFALGSTSNFSKFSASLET